MCSENLSFSYARHCLMAESRHSVAVTLSRISDELHLVYEREVVYCLKFQRIRSRLRTCRYSQKGYPACAPDMSLAPTSDRQMWRHNYVIGRNEYIIFTFRNLPLFVMYIHCNFCANLHIILEGMEEKTACVFFWTVYNARKHHDRRHSPRSVSDTDVSSVIAISAHLQLVSMDAGRKIGLIDGRRLHDNLPPEKIRWSVTHCAAACYCPPHLYGPDSLYSTIDRITGRAGLGISIKNIRIFVRYRSKSNGKFAVLGCLYAVQFISNQQI